MSFHLCARWVVAFEHGRLRGLLASRAEKVHSSPEVRAVRHDWQQQHQRLTVGVVRHVREAWKIRGLEVLVSLLEERLSQASLRIQTSRARRKQASSDMSRISFHQRQKDTELTMGESSVGSACLPSMANNASGSCRRCGLEGAH